MLLTMSTPNPRSAAFTNDQGQALFKCETPSTAGHKTTRIYKIAPNADADDMRDRFVLFAEIEWHVLAPSRFRFDGKEVTAKEYMHGPKIGIGWHRCFTGPDGKPYRWEADIKAPRGYTRSRRTRTRTTCAISQRSGKGAIGKAQHAGLEVFEEGRHMLGTIVLTFVYMLKMFQEYEGSVHSSMLGT
ncbi:hypothetical protein CONPUDRAFT_60585 [Coniophora puteana RWD-64-598 SS2]|uniref:DUF6593 domain-containing protein n=1 Tax=Coniophora puteana (strain RWD-64-598) TaxID=741705 RepID=A0A5M3MHU1_CONPW|nr:uncharacterized protein CONPUDRAFT_60585 [Coniophora puteana RWD-64-598 SS2]EIW78354.1 hypothetical protein CONPUDRAFT_60585 [Coniophora puteana RWD-64-598 SS2]